MKQLLIPGVLMLMTVSSCSGPLYTPGSARETAVDVGKQTVNTEGFLETEEGIELYYFSQGTGEPVLMIHGGPGYPHRTGWDSLTPLSNRYRFVYYHQRGAGKSTRPVNRFDSKNYSRNVRALDQALGLAAHLRDIEAFRLALKVEKISLFGHSFGGFLAALYAAEYPDHVKSLVLVAPAEVVRMPMKHSGGLYESVREKLAGPVKDDFDSFLKRFFDYGKIFRKDEGSLQDLNHEFLRFYEAAVGGTDNVPVANSFSRDEIAGWGQHAVFFSMGRTHDYTDTISSLTVPTLILTGSRDLASRQEILDTYGRIPGCRTAELEAGHFSFIEAGDSFRETVKDFLDEPRALE